jgi:hypothetical protein
MTPEQLVAVASPKINALGSAFYFDVDTLERGKAAGLDGFRMYFLGRGGVLGDVEPAVVTSAFGWFAPELVTKIWTSAKALMGPREGAQLYQECAAALGRKKLAGVEGIATFCALAERVVSAADPAGLTLFAGWAAEPRADDAPARAMQLLAVLRELRGSAHLVAVLATGVSPQLAHYAKRPDMYQAFGYAEAPEVTDDDRAKLADAEALTDQLVLPAWRSLTHDEAETFAGLLDRIEAALA